MNVPCANSRLRLSYIEAVDEAFGVDVEFEVGFEVAPLVGVEMAVYMQAVVFYPVDAGEALVADGFAEEVVEVHLVAVVVELGVFGEKFEPVIGVAVGQGLYGRAYYGVGEFIGLHGCFLLRCVGMESCR